MLGKSLKAQGIIHVYPKEKQKWYVKAPAFSFSKLNGMDTYLSPEMKSTGEAIGYDKTLTRALYKALKSSGINVANYGTVFVTSDLFEKIIVSIANNEEKLTFVYLTEIFNTIFIIRKQKLFA